MSRSAPNEEGDQQVYLEELPLTDCACNPCPSIRIVASYASAFASQQANASKSVQNGPSPRGGHSLTRVRLATQADESVSEEFVILFGGSSERAEYYNDVWAFKTSSNTWNRCLNVTKGGAQNPSATPSPRGGHVAVACPAPSSSTSSSSSSSSSSPSSLSNSSTSTVPSNAARILVHGGQVVKVDWKTHSMESHTFFELWAMDIWCGKSNTIQFSWTPLQPVLSPPILPLLRSGSSTFSLPADASSPATLLGPKLKHAPPLNGHTAHCVGGRVYLFFGAGTEGPSSAVHVYDIASQTLGEAAPAVSSSSNTNAKPAPREMHTSFLTQDAAGSASSPHHQVVVTGGRGFEGMTADVWAFDVDTHAWAQLGCAPPLCSHISLPFSLPFTSSSSSASSASSSSTPPSSSPYVILVGGVDGAAITSFLHCSTVPIVEDSWASLYNNSTPTTSSTSSSTPSSSDQAPASSSRSARCPTCRGPRGWAVVPAQDITTPTSSFSSAPGPDVQKAVEQASSSAEATTDGHDHGKADAAKVVEDAEALSLFARMALAACPVTVPSVPRTHQTIMPTPSSTSTSTSTSSVPEGGGEAKAGDSASSSSSNSNSSNSNSSSKIIASFLMFGGLNPEHPAFETLLVDVLATVPDKNEIVIATPRAND